MSSATKKPRSDLFTRRLKQKSREQDTNHRKLDLGTRLAIAYDIRDNSLTASSVVKKYKISPGQARHLWLTHQAIIARLEFTGTNIKSQHIGGKRHPIIVLAEPRLSWWICELNSKGFPVSTLLVKEKMKMICNLLCEQLGVSNLEFVASNGWFDGFRQRENLINYKMSGEKLGADEKAVEPFRLDLKRLTQESGYQLCQVYNGDETGLFWQLIPKSTFAPGGTSSVISGHKQSKKRVTLFLAANSTGDHRTKPFLIYESESCQGMPRPRSASARTRFLADLPVEWCHQPKAWMDTPCFKKCIEVFCTEAKRFQSEIGIPEDDQKCLLLVDNAPSHRKFLEENPEFTSGSTFLRIHCLPPNTTSLLQPQDQAINRSFKARYTSIMLRDLILKLDQSLVTGDVASKLFSSITILNAIPMIGEAWRAIPSSTLKYAWNKLFHNLFDGYVSKSLIKMEEKQAELVEQANKYRIDLEQMMTGDCDLSDLISISEKEKAMFHIDHRLEISKPGGEDSPPSHSCLSPPPSLSCLSPPPLKPTDLMSLYSKVCVFPHVSPQLSTTISPVPDTNPDEFCSTVSPVAQTTVKKLPSDLDSHKGILYWISPTSVASQQEPVCSVPPNSYQTKISNSSTPNKTYSKENLSSPMPLKARNVTCDQQLNLEFFSLLNKNNSRVLNDIFANFQLSNRETKQQIITNFKLANCDDDKENYYK